MTRYYRYNWCDMQELDQTFDLIDLTEFLDVYAVFVSEGIPLVIRKTFISISGHGCRMSGYLNESEHKFILSFLLDVMDSLANAAEINLSQKDRYLRWYELLDKLYLRLRQKPVAYDDKPAE